MVAVEAAGAGDIISMTGLAAPAIGHTVSNSEVEQCLGATYPCQLPQIH